jgi:hypothetical protein
LIVLPAARVTAIACRSASGTSPSASISACTTWHWKALKTPSAPTYDGASQMTTSPGSQKIRVTRSTACWDPTVTTTSSGWALMPSSAITSQICSRRVGSPCPEEYWQRDRAVVADQVADGAADDVERQAGDVGHPAGQRDHLGPGRDGEQGADLEAVMPWVRAA